MFKFKVDVVYPISTNDEGVKINPDNMEKEKLYHCIFKDKVLVFFKDHQDGLNCYEIEEKDLVDKVKQCEDKNEIEKIFEDYIKSKNLNTKH